MAVPHFIKCEPASDNEVPNEEFQSVNPVKVEVEPDLSFADLHGGEEHDLDPQDVKGEPCSEDLDLSNDTRSSTPTSVCETPPSQTHGSSTPAYNAFRLDDKPFACLSCFKTFTRRSSLSRHMLAHRGDLAHRCANCGKGFTRREHLAAHTIKHTAPKPTPQVEKPYSCSVCGKTFLYRSHLNNHVAHSKPVNV
ncbi:gastrula zinc finger protein XlCGF28.1 [Anabrus simplex]|uniref:gastrula zinc finger protein XlCGF28.1 n=1 Tax=Anabrus simplex TaxID=316456 RepID=UPI0035A3B149